MPLPWRRSRSAHVAGPFPSESRTSLTSVRARLEAEPDAVRALLAEAVRLACPADPAPPEELVTSIVEVCVQTLLDAHDFEKAVRRAEHDGVTDADEAIELIADWTARRERARIGRARGRARA